MKNILIVGGSHGIGAELLSQLKGEHNCINMSRTNPEDDSLTHYSLDVLKDELPELEALDALIYCPGSINLKPLSSLKESDLEEDFKINTIGAFRVLKNYLPLLKKSDSATVVFFGTVAAQTGMPFHTSVAAAKGALEAMTRSLAAELSPGIRVNCVSPSLTNTPLAERLLKSDKQQENARERHPLKRYGEATDIANAAAFLISDKASWITGQVLGVDGGLSTIHN